MEQTHLLRFEEATELGIWTRAEAARIRAEGDRVIASARCRPAGPTGGEHWRPPAASGLLRLPKGSDVV